MFLVSRVKKSYREVLCNRYLFASESSFIIAIFELTDLLEIRPDYRYAICVTMRRASGDDKDLKV